MALRRPRWRQQPEHSCFIRAAEAVLSKLNAYHFAEFDDAGHEKNVVVEGEANEN